MARSVARREDGPDSDVDLLVDLPEGTSLFAVLALEGALQRILAVDVDLAVVTSMKPRVRAEARRRCGRLVSRRDLTAESFDLRKNGV